MGYPFDCFETVGVLDHTVVNMLAMREPESSPGVIGKSNVTHATFGGRDVKDVR